MILLRESLGYESDERLEYWNGNRNTPILKRGKQGFSHQVVVGLLLHKKSKRECSKKPVGVKENMSFFINLTNLLTKMIGPQMTLEAGETEEITQLF